MIEMAFTVDMKPIGKGRPRFTKTGRTYTPAATKAAEKLISDQFALWCGEKTSGPVSLTVEAFYAAPKSWPKAKREAVSDVPLWKETAPDIDNIVKLVCDALNGLAWDDDKQVVDIAASKMWADRDHLLITIREAWG